VAWLGVPLNAGAETIGALSLGSRDPRVEYSGEQLSLAQSIADQVAGAIVKARLLQETERHALQLTTLNEVTRQLTSTLELEPLLQNILQSAVDILSCAAGSLLLVDETSDELVFRVVVSPVASDLLNRRLPAGVGVVGKAVKSKGPIIVNDVTRFPEWFSQTDKKTGFLTRALLVIPLLVKERVIGVIEVINKKDGSPFSQDDQDLLAAFAAQAAVAIENARLYTLTDQALAARVEELSVMQRIDRELNTSLESAAAMRITLEWAMRQTGAQAGFIGTLEEDKVRVMASQGYQGDVERYEGLLPLDELGLSEIVSEPAPMRRSLAVGTHGQRLLVEARSQAVVPIRRETETIGLVFLESMNPAALDDDALAFLVRLGDHAAVSIFNAQLYTAVRNANLAKSEFVSFVAHELKNPMTSVKGYTELLAAGAVGAINDAQSGFLNTIRSNIERMNTLVSDLNDMSKIEVGRLRLDFKAIPAAEVVEGVIRSTRRQIDEKQQKLTIDLPADLPPAWADRTRLEQVMVNLVSNAHKYTQPGGEIFVSAAREKNQWDPAGAAEVLHIAVRDTGIGISEEDQAKIFQKFFRSEDPKTREVPGTGLGLNITKSLVEMQGGKIWFESVYRQGTTFHFTIPISSQ
jgi:signal transduction histidine kinase